MCIRDRATRDTDTLCVWLTLERTRPGPGYRTGHSTKVGTLLHFLSVLRPWSTWSAGCSLGSGTPASASRQPRMVNGMTGPKAKDKVECRLEGSGWAALYSAIQHVFQYSPQYSILYGGRLHSIVWRPHKVPTHQTARRGGLLSRCKSQPLRLGRLRLAKGDEAPVHPVLAR